MNFNDLLQVVAADLPPVCDDAQNAQFVAYPWMRDVARNASRLRNLEVHWMWDTQFEFCFRSKSFRSFWF